MAADRRALDDGVAQLYARAVLAVARAGGALAPDEGSRLVACLEGRSGRPVALADLLLAEPLDPAELAALRQRAASPFRGAAIHARELAALIVADAIAVVLGKGHVSEEEARELVRFAVALGCTIDDVRAMSEHLVPFLAALDEGIALPARPARRAALPPAPRAAPAPGSTSRRRRPGTGR